MTNSPLKCLTLLGFCSILGIAACAAAGSRHVRAYEITAVAISVDPAGGYRITAQGRMRTGGHANPRLRPVGATGTHGLVLELIADGPPPGAMVAMVLQPVSADYRTTGKGIKSVRVVGETNDMRRRLPHK